MKIYNTLNRKIEEVRVDDNKISLYTCGPTVYDYVHIGNLRTFIFEDVLRRALESEGINVDQVMNITDVDDKTIRASGGNRGKFETVTKKYTDAFLADLEKLNIKKPNEMPKATAYISQITKFISDLLDRGYAYKGDDGSIYFSIEKFKDYGKLSHLDKEGLKAGARVSSDEYDKENPADFALWKAWDESDGDIYWKTSLGKGRPGWHIECSVMSKENIGDNVDIHAGGVDLIFPHHENEIAQSEALSGKKFVNYWVHGEHLLVDGKKMSKSSNNFYKLSDLEEKGFSPLDFRYLCLQSHYRSKLNFTWEALESAKNARKRLTRITQEISQTKTSQNQTEDGKTQKAREFLSNDLNTPELLAYIWEILRDEKTDNAKKLELLKWADTNILGLDLLQENDPIVPAEISELQSKREILRKEGKYFEADEVRKEIETRGYIIKDTKKGSVIEKNE